MSLVVVLVCSAMFVENVIGTMLTDDGRVPVCCANCMLDVFGVEVAVEALEVASFVVEISVEV